MPVVLVLTVAGCRGDGSDRAQGLSGASDRPVPVDQWYGAWMVVKDDINQLHAGGEGQKPFEEQCREGEKEFEDRRALLLAPDDERLREVAPAWVEVVERYYDACRSGAKEERAKTMREGHEPTDAIAQRLRQLGYGI